MDMVWVAVASPLQCLACEVRERAIWSALEAWKPRTLTIASMQDGATTMGSLTAAHWHVSPLPWLWTWSSQQLSRQYVYSWPSMSANWMFIQGFSLISKCWTQSASG